MIRLHLTGAFCLAFALTVSAQVQSGMLLAGASLPATCAPGYLFVNTSEPSLSICTSMNTWTTMQTTSGSLPTGAVLLITSGTCPAGYTEASDLNGKMVRGTLAANGNVGQAGGSDSATPTVASLTAAAQTFTGTPFTQVINHTHPVNDPGHTHLTQRYPTATGGSSGFTIDTSMSGTLADNTLPTKTATTGITTANPAGGVASITPAGTNSTSAVTGTLNSISTVPSYVNVIFCRKS